MTVHLLADRHNDRIKVRCGATLTKNDSWTVWWREVTCSVCVPDEQRAKAVNPKAVNP